MSDCYAHIVAVGVRSTQLLRLIGIAMATASLLVSILPATGRADETLFASNFGSDPGRPSHHQAVGTATWWASPHNSVTTSPGSLDGSNDGTLLLKKAYDTGAVGIPGPILPYSRVWKLYNSYETLILAFRRRQGS